MPHIPNRGINLKKRLPVLVKKPVALLLSFVVDTKVGSYSPTFYFCPDLFTYLDKEESFHLIHDTMTPTMTPKSLFYPRTPYAKLKLAQRFLKRCKNKWKFTDRHLRTTDDKECTKKFGWAKIKRKNPYL